MKDSLHWSDSPDHASTREGPLDQGSIQDHLAKPVQSRPRAKVLGVPGQRSKILGPLPALDEPNVPASRDFYDGRLGEKRDAGGLAVLKVSYEHTALEHGSQDLRPRGKNHDVQLDSILGLQAEEKVGVGLPVMLIRRFHDNAADLTPGLSRNQGRQRPAERLRRKRAYRSSKGVLHLVGGGHHDVVVPLVGAEEKDAPGHRRT